MPKSPIFSQLFARSPISPIQDHMKLSCEAASHLPAFFNAVLAQDWEAAKPIGEKIVRLESEADDIKRKVRSNLPRSLFMPVSRSDLLELLQSQDKIPNRAKDVVGLTLGRQMTIPGEIGSLLVGFVESSVKAVTFALKALNELDELLETGFSGREVDLIEDMIVELNTAEHESDDLQSLVQKKLFAMEDELNAVDVMFLYRLIEWIGDIADNAQSVGNRMLYLIAK